MSGFRGRRGSAYFTSPMMAPDMPHAVHAAAGGSGGAFMGTHGGPGAAAAPRHIKSLGKRRVLTAVLIIQRRVRAFFAGRVVRRKYALLRGTAVKLQIWARGHNQRVQYQRYAQGSRLVQRVWRGMKGRRMVQELRTASQMVAEKAFLEMQLERERLWLAMMQQQLYEADSGVVSAPLCVDLAINLDEIYPQGWSNVMSDMISTKLNAAAASAASGMGSSHSSTSTTTAGFGGGRAGAASTATSTFGHGSRGLDSTHRQYNKQQRHGYRPIRSICCGATSTAVLFEGGEAMSFGWADCGQLGQGTCNNAPKAKPISHFRVAASSIHRSPSVKVFVKKMASGDDHTLLLSEQGELFSFGSNAWGQLGRSYNAAAKKNFSSLPRPVELKRPCVDVACGSYHSAVLLDGGIILSWGSWDMKRPDPDDLFMPKRVMRSPHTCRSIHCGRSFSAVLAHDGNVWCWGSNSQGQLGLGTYAKEAKIPTRVFWAPTLASGQPGRGQLAEGAKVAYLAPQAALGVVAKVVRVKQRNDGTYFDVLCEDGTKVNEVSRGKLYHMEALKLKQLDLGGHHVVGIHPAHGAVAWGSNKHGQVGVDNGPVQPLPTQVPFPVHPSMVGQVAAGLRHSVAVSTANKVFAWGHAGSFRFVNPNGGGTLVDSYARSRQPTILNPHLVQFPGLLSSPTPVEVVGWGPENQNGPLSLSLECSFSRGLSVTLLRAVFEEGIGDTLSKQHLKLLSRAGTSGFGGL